MAATIRTSTRTGFVPPTGRISRSSSTRRSFAWRCVDISLISSRRSVPPSAASKSPCLLEMAPVKAPRTCPKSSDSISSFGIAAQFTPTNGPFLRLELKWIVLARSVLPVPLSPVRSTVARDSASRLMVAKSSCTLELLPTMLPSV